MIPVIFEMIQSRPITKIRMKITRRMTRVGGPYTSTAAFAAETATSFASFEGIREPNGSDSSVQPADHLSHRFLIVITQFSELDSKRVDSCMMDHLSSKRQGVLAIEQQQPELVAHFNVRHGGKVVSPKTAEPNVWCSANPDRSFRP